MNRELFEQILDISKTLSDNAGRMSFGGRSFVNSVADNDEVDIVTFADEVARENSSAAIRNLSDKSSLLKEIVFAAANSDEESAVNEIIKLVPKIHPDDAMVLIESLHEYNFKVDVAIDTFPYRKFKYGEYDATLLELIRAFNYARMRGGPKTNMPHKILRATCAEADKVLSIKCVDERDMASEKMINYLADNYSIRKSASSTPSRTLKIVIMMECSKILVNHGVIINDNYTTWAEEAIKYGLWWHSRKQESQKYAEDICVNLMKLLNADIIPPMIVDNAILKMEESCKSLDEMKVYPSLALRQEFKRRFEDDRYLKKMLRRLAENTGRGGSRSWPRQKK